MSEDCGFFNFSCKKKKECINKYKGDDESYIKRSVVMNIIKRKKYVSDNDSKLYEYIQKEGIDTKLLTDEDIINIIKLLVDFYKSETDYILGEKFDSIVFWNYDRKDRQKLKNNLISNYNELKKMVLNNTVDIKTKDDVMALENQFELCYDYLKNRPYY